MDKNSWGILFIKQFKIFFLILILMIFRIIPLYFGLIGYILYCFYHKIFSYTKLLFTKNTKIEKIIQKANLNSIKFHHSFFFPNTPLQFLNLNRTKVNPNCKILVERKYIGTNGVCIDWLKYEGINNEKNPILIIFPGLTGSIEEPYVLNIASEAIINGHFNTCIYQMRLLNENVKVQKRYLFLLDDIDEALDELIKEYGEDKIIYGLGFSYGANQLMKYLGQKNCKKKKIYAAVSISNLFEFIIFTRLRVDTFYYRMLLSLLQKVIKKTRKGLENNKNLEIPFERILNTNSLEEFDDNYTSYTFGFAGADDYYRGASCISDIYNINVPLLCINALDDQIAVKEGIPFNDIKRNPNIALMVTSHGTHSCFIESNGLFGVKQWIPKPAIRFLKAVIKED